MHDPGPAAGGEARAAGGGTSRGSGSGLLRRHWPTLRRLLLLAFFAVVAVLLARFARAVDWAEVGATLTGYDPRLLIVAGVLAATSYLLYGSYDLLARHYTGHHLTARQTLGVALISYAFNLNLGALIGGAAFRLRMYSRLGLDQATIARIIAFSVMTNWLGYLGVAAFAFTLARPPLPDDWWLAGGALTAIGVAAGVAVLVWLAMCAWSPRRELEAFGHRIELPSARVALLQLVVAGANWLVIAVLIHLLLQRQVEYPTVLAVTLTAAIAGALTHVPAGLGVLEGVFLAVLGATVGQGPLLAALLAHRAIYYIGPLLLAVAGYLVIETRTRSAAR